MKYYLLLVFYVRSESCWCTQCYSTTLSTCHLFYWLDFAIYIFNCIVSYFLFVYVLTYVCRARSWIAPFFLPVPWIMYTFSWCLYVTAQSNIRQRPVSLQNSPLSNIKLIQPHHLSQPEPVKFRHATTSVWYVWYSSAPASIICH